MAIGEVIEMNDDYMSISVLERREIFSNVGLTPTPYIEF